MPLLFETGYGDSSIRSVLVVAPEDDRVARVVARDRIDEAHVRARMAAQIGPRTTRALAPMKSSTTTARCEHLRAQTAAVYERLRAS